MRFLATAVLVYLLARPGTLDAQARSVVTDNAGRPLAEATVELWGPTRRLAASVSTADGSVRFARAAADSATGLWVRRIGYRPLRLAIVDSLPARLTLEPMAAPLPELTVALARRACPNREDPRARALWASVARRYTDASSLARSSVGAFWTAIVEPENVGRMPDGAPGTREGTTTSAGTGFYREAHARHGYAIRLPAPGGDERFYAWMYAPLWEEGMADHFIEPSFGAAHTLAINHVSAGETLISFCPRDRDDDRPAIEGTLAIGADSSLLRVSWRYRTPKPDERAGGEATYAPLAAGPGPSYLLPIQAAFWRRSNDDYLQQVIVYSEWRVGAR